MLHTKDCQRELCRIIASLPRNSSFESVAAALNPIIETVDISLIQQQDNEREKVSTPLMVACDKSQIQCLRYFEAKVSADSSKRVESLKSVFGHPLQASPDSGNTAAHYAALSCCCEAIDVLSRMLMIWKRLPDDVTLCKEDEDQISRRSQYFSLLMQRNNHGDTPVMMACVNGDSALLEHWVQELHNISKIEKFPLTSSHRGIKKMLQLKNDSDDTALSLTYGHGNVELLDFLLKGRKVGGRSKNMSCDEKSGQNLVDVTFEDIEKCKVLLKKIDLVLSSVDNIVDVHTTDQIQCYKARRRNVHRCLVMLEVSSAQIAQEKMNEILEDSHDMNVAIQIIPQHKRSKKKKKIRKRQEKVNQPQSKDGEISSDRNICAGREANTMEGLRFITLEDGSVVSSMDGKKDRLKHGEDISEFMEVTSLKDKNIDEMLRERCMKHISSPPGLSNDKIISDSDSESIMDSLCLDASMLLLTPQSMAMKLSPSQLEAVEIVLKNQLDAVFQAKEIHKRLLSSAGNQPVNTSKLPKLATKALR